MKKYEILVGIPENRTERNEGEMNNASLLYLHSKGSPLHNLPARPVLEPAIEESSNRGKLDAGLAQAMRFMLKGNKDGYVSQLNRVGLMASSMCKEWFTNPANNWQPNKPATVLGKIRKIKSKKKRGYFKASFSAKSTMIDAILLQ